MHIHSMLLATATILCFYCLGWAQDDLFLYQNASSQLPFDPAANDKDSLGMEAADFDGDGDLDLFITEGSAGPFGFPNLLWINDGTGNFTDESAARLPQDASNSAVPTSSATSRCGSEYSGIGDVSSAGLLVHLLQCLLQCSGIEVVR